MSVKRRLIFTLLYSDGSFMLSRNFRLQVAGDLDWLQRHYNFPRTAQAIDELIVLNVSRDPGGLTSFPDTLKRIVESVFIPVSAGGGIRDLVIAERLLHSGADKLVVNTALIRQPQLVADLVVRYGSQCVVASVDVLRSEESVLSTISNATELLDISLSDHLQFAKDLGVGEVYLNSVTRDGTGQGYDLDLLSAVPSNYPLPIILAGGAGNSRHFVEALATNSVDAVATANIFNFVGSGLLRARTTLIDYGYRLASIEPVPQRQ